MPGPMAGSEGARKISDIHSGSHDHDQTGGFAHDRDLAVRARRMGGEAVKRKYGMEFYRKIGKKGGDTIKQERGVEFYAGIGRRGGNMRSQRMKERKALLEAGG